ncbi:MAG: hypothetical protein N3G74_02100 [Candidatus Micrarchaeota archaeon]|nr:hypothetical protein [Candidatus Micrarchaeota archaeon]
MVKEILFPKELKPEESVPVILEGVFGGTVAGLGMMTIGAFFSPEVSTALVSASAVASGFATTIILQEKRNLVNKKAEAKEKKKARK